MEKTWYKNKKHTENTKNEIKIEKTRFVNNYIIQI